MRGSAGARTYQESGRTTTTESLPANVAVLRAWAARNLPPQHPVAALIGDLDPGVGTEELLAKASDWARLLQILPLCWTS